VTSAIFITVRTSSSRLPTKALLPLYKDTPLIQHIINRAKISKNADRVILCTTRDSADDVLCEIASKSGIDFYRGPTNDKLERWNQAANNFKVKYFATFDGDDPLCCPDLIDASLKQIQRDEVDFIESAKIATGAYTYTISSAALSKVCEIKESDETEMMWTYFKDTGLFKLAELEGVPDKLKNKPVRLTLDYPEDLDFFREIFQRMPMRHEVSLESVIDLLMADDNLRNINFSRQEDFLSNQARNTHLKIKGGEIEAK